MPTKSTLPTRTERGARGCSADDDKVFHYPNGVALPPVHPGQTLVQELEVTRPERERTCLKLSVPANRLTEIVRV